MKILVTGNQGYLGPVVIRHLRRAIPGCEIVGFDAGYFAGCLTVFQRPVSEHPDRQILGDVRQFPVALLKGVDAVIHLAAISNDPMGNKFSEVTREINHQASRELAILARRSGVRRFVFASSCSVYGVDNGTLKSEESAVQPLSAYAQSKIATEDDIKGLANSSFVVTALRFATACGFSSRCRLDLVLNDFVASGLANREITLLSDGSPWRPLIHVEDMARAMEWALVRNPKQGGNFLSVNTGSRQWNIQMRDLAQAVAKEQGKLTVRTNPDAVPDKRSYRVDFSKFERLAPYHQPRWSLQQAVEDLADGLRVIIREGFLFRQSSLIRLRVLSELVATGRLDRSLRWMSDVVRVGQANPFTVAHNPSSSLVTK